MRTVHDLKFRTGSKEEKLPDFHAAFPYISSRAELNYYKEAFVPWHWHNAVELFYMESGRLTYHTPNKTVTFPAGSGGMVNSNVLHMTKIQSSADKNIQLLHIFDPLLIAGSHGSLIEQKYILPVTTDTNLEIIAFYPDNPLHTDILDSIRKAFQLQEKDFGYELNIRNALSQIWLQLLKLPYFSAPKKTHSADKIKDRIKTMMIYIHEHYGEKITIAQLADAAHLSERKCYRIFQKCLHMTPAEYIQSYRLQMACRMLTEGQETITDIGYFCRTGQLQLFRKNLPPTDGIHAFGIQTKVAE